MNKAVLVFQLEQDVQDQVMEQMTDKLISEGFTGYDLESKIEFVLNSRISEIEDDLNMDLIDLGSENE